MTGKERALVVYYSYSGNTRTVGRAIAERLGADTEEIVDLNQKHGPMLYVIGGFKAFLKRLTRIGPATHDPQDYDLVILGSPVYAGHMPSPVRTYLQQQGKRIASSALFITCGDPQNAKVIDALAASIGHEPRARMAVSQADMASGSHQEAVERFCEQLGS